MGHTASGRRFGSVPGTGHWPSRPRPLVGEVEVQPFDAGGTWSAVLRDLAGAGFSVNDFGDSS